MNARISVFVIFVEAIIYLLLYNLHDCTFNSGKCVILLISFEVKLRTCSFGKKNKADQSFSFKEMELNGLLSNFFGYITWFVISPD